jgi:hypothetical protein
MSTPLLEGKHERRNPSNTSEIDDLHDRALCRNIPWQEVEMVFFQCAFIFPSSLFVGRQITAQK